MIRSILVALDETPGAHAAAEAAIRLARRTGAHLSAAVVLDDPHTRNHREAVPPGAGAFLAHRNAELARRAEAEAEVAVAAFTAAAGDLSFEILRLSAAPLPALLGASKLHDLVVVGRDSTLGQDEVDGGLAAVIPGLLHHGARPLLVVPPGPVPSADAPVIIGYDGSVPVQQALASFAMMRMAEGARVVVVSIDDDQDKADALADEAACFLRRHELAAEAVGLEGDRPIAMLLAEVLTLKPRLLVAGAFEESGLRTFLLGSGTRKLLTEATCPIFIQH